MGNTIVIDDGRKTYEIVNKQGEIIGRFSFNPADLGIATRYDKVIDRVNAIQLPVDITEDQLSAELQKVQDEVCECLDYLLNDKVAENFFSIMNPLTPLANGQLFVENVLDAIGTIVEEETGARMKKVNSKLKKYTQKYNA